MASVSNSEQPVHDEVLTKAILNLAKSYGLSGRELSEIIGISEASASRLHQGKKYITAHTKEGELSLLLLRVYRGLYALIGPQHEKAQAWLRERHHYFNCPPLESMKSVQGLVSVVQYLDAMREKI